MAGEPDPELHRWVDTQIQVRKAKGERLIYWQLLWFRTATDESLANALTSGELFKLWQHKGRLAFRLSGRQIAGWTRYSHPMSQLVYELPLDVVGSVLLNADRYSDLDKWATLIFRGAHEALSQSPLERAFWGSTTLTKDESGVTQASTCNAWELAPATGAADVAKERAQPAEVNTLIKSRGPDEHEEQANQLLKLWKADRDKALELDRGALSDFGAVRALRAWRDRNTTAFLTASESLIREIENCPSTAPQIGGFVCALLDVLAEVDPVLAINTDRRLRTNGFCINTQNQYGTSTFPAALWRSAGRGVNGGREVCSQMLQTSTSDHELMTHAMIAQAEGAEDFLRALCDNLVGNTLARERCLGISLLPWFGDDSGSVQLRRMSAEDASGWVRGHAAWAAEVATQELSARNYYAEILKQAEINTMRRMLQVLKPALTTTSLWWHGALEQATGFSEAAPPRIQAAIELFWYDHESELKKPADLFGRKLENYLRGDEISHLDAPRPRLI